MTSLMTSSLYTAGDSRLITGNSWFWREINEKGPPSIAILHIHENKIHVCNKIYDQQPHI